MALPGGPSRFATSSHTYAVEIFSTYWIYWLGDGLRQNVAGRPRGLLDQIHSAYPTRHLGILFVDAGIAVA